MPTRENAHKEIDRIQQRMVEERLMCNPGTIDDELNQLLDRIKNGDKPPEHGVKITNQELQVLMLAIAKLALERPGWNWMLGEVADRFDGRALFEEFKDLYYHETLNL